MSPAGVATVSGRAVGSLVLACALTASAANRMAPSTRLGSMPTWPSELAPHAHVSPSAVTTTVNDRPHATCVATARSFSLCSSSLLARYAPTRSASSVCAAVCVGGGGAAGACGLMGPVTVCRRPPDTKYEPLPPPVADAAVGAAGATAGVAAAVAGVAAAAAAAAAASRASFTSPTGSSTRCRTRTRPRTRRGDTAFSSSPCPSRPLRPRPHVHTAPRESSPCMKRCAAADACGAPDPPLPPAATGVAAAAAAAAAAEAAAAAAGALMPRHRSSPPSPSASASCALYASMAASSVPPMVIAAVCAPPAAMDTTRNGIKAATRRGCTSSAVPPCPSRPSTPTPHVYTSKCGAEDSATACCMPHATATTRTLRSARSADSRCTSTGPRAMAASSTTSMPSPSSSALIAGCRARYSLAASPAAAAAVAAAADMVGSVPLLRARASCGMGDVATGSTTPDADRTGSRLLPGAEGRCPPPPLLPPPPPPPPPPSSLSLLSAAAGSASGLCPEITHWYTSPVAVSSSACDQLADAATNRLLCSPCAPVSMVRRCGRRSTSASASLPPPPPPPPLLAPPRRTELGALPPPPPPPLEAPPPPRPLERRLVSSGYSTGCNRTVGSGRPPLLPRAMGDTRPNATSWCWYAKRG